jgi:hypothetical protein
MKRALLLAALVACSADEPVAEVTSADYKLEAVTAFAGAHHVVGVDTDRAGGVWIAYQLQSAVYTFDDLRVLHLDAAGATLAELHYTDADAIVSGLAFTGDALWLCHCDGELSRRRLRKIDPATGVDLATLPVEAGIQDIAVRDDLILLSSTWRELVAIDATSGAEQWRAPVAALAHSESRGLAASTAGTWVVSLLEARAVLVDDSGVTIESAAFPFAAEEWSADDGLQLALDGEMLVLHRRNQITWYAPK